MRADQTPVADALVWLLRDDPPYGEQRLFDEHRENLPWNFVAETRTAADGSFALHNVQHRNYWLGVAPSEMGTSEVSLARRIAVDEHDVEVELVIQEGAVLQGQILNPDGEPAPGATAIVFDEFVHVMSESDSRGEFRIDALAPGRYEIVAATQDSISKQKQVHTGEERLVLELETKGLVRGRVIGNDGEPLVDAQVQLFGGLSDWDFSEEDGSFELRTAPGNGTLIATASGDRISRPIAIDVEPGQEILDVEARLEQGGRLRVRIKGQESALLSVSVSWGGHVVASEMLYPGSSTELVVPLGDVTVEVHDAEGTLFSSHARVGREGVAEVVID